MSDHCCAVLQNFRIHFIILINLQNTNQSPGCLNFLIMEDVKKNSLFLFSKIYSVTQSQPEYMSVEK